MIWDYYMNKLSNSGMYTILIITKQRHLNQYAQQDRLRKSCIKTTLDQYSGITYALKEYKELDYITNDHKYIANLLLKNMNKSNIFSNNISSLIFESLDLLNYLVP